MNLDTRRKSRHQERPYQHLCSGAHKRLFSSTTAGTRIQIHLDIYLDLLCWVLFYGPDKGMAQGAPTLPHLPYLPQDSTWPRRSPFHLERLLLQFPHSSVRSWWWQTDYRIGQNLLPGNSWPLDRNQIEPLQYSHGPEKLVPGS